jgi:hypothetical protein
MLPKARHEDIATQQIGDDLVLYDSQYRCFRTLNRTAAFVWRHCDGHTSVQEMARLLNKHLNIPADEALVHLTLKQLAKAQLLLEAPAKVSGPGLSRREMVLRFGAMSALILPAVFTLTGCGGGGGTSGGPTGVQAQTKYATTTWNGTFGTNVQLVNFADTGTITSNAQINQLAVQMSDPTTTWLPTGDPTVPSQVSAARIADDPTITSQQITTYQNMVKALLRVGQTISQVTWTKNGQTFTTIMIHDANNVIYDSILFNIRMQQPGKDMTCLNFNLVNGFGFVMGSISAINKPTCDSLGRLIACDFDCQGSDSFGDAKCLGQTTQVGDRCCQLSYNWADVTGFKSIEVGADKYTLKITGYLGAGLQGNGSCTACCPSGASGTGG